MMFNGKHFSLPSWLCRFESGWALQVFLDKKMLIAKKAVKRVKKVRMKTRARRFYPTQPKVAKPVAPSSTWHDESEDCALAIALETENTSWSGAEFVWQMMKAPDQNPGLFYCKRNIYINHDNLVAWLCVFLDVWIKVIVFKTFDRSIRHKPGSGWS